MISRRGYINLRSRFIAVERARRYAGREHVLCVARVILRPGNHYIFFAVLPGRSGVIDIIGPVGTGILSGEPFRGTVIFLVAVAEVIAVAFSSYLNFYKINAGSAVFSRVIRGPADLRRLAI